MRIKHWRNVKYERMLTNVVLKRLGEKMCRINVSAL